MQAAANLTGIDVELFRSPNRSEAENDSFRTGLDAVLERGLALAWRAHLDTVEHIVGQRHESALVVEDDIDWDIHVKEQLEQVSRAFAVRNSFLSGIESKLVKDQDWSIDAAYPYGLVWCVNDIQLVEHTER